MVGKVKHVRHKLHQQAVKLHSLPQPGGTELTGRPLQTASPLQTARPLQTASPLQTARPLQTANPLQTSREEGQSSFPSGVFAATKIPAASLVQTLSLEEPPQIQPTNTGSERRRPKPKKEKMKERRERWLSKIGSIRRAQEQEAAAARRQATPVVGDLRPLADALPELCQLIGPPATLGSRRKTRKNQRPMRRPAPTDFSQMKRSQKRKVLETEISRFSDAIRTLSSKQNPLADIGEQLRKRMRQEEEQGGSGTGTGPDLKDPI